MHRYAPAALLPLVFALGAPNNAAKAQASVSGSPGAGISGELATLSRGFNDAMQALHAKAEGRPTRAEVTEVVNAWTPKLKKFIENEAKDADRYNGRLMLADWHMSVFDLPAAQAALRGIDPKTTPPLPLLMAAATAARMRMSEEQKEWTRLAVAKARDDAPLEERMSMASLLLTALQDVPAGEAILANAIKSARGDEEKARVRFMAAEVSRDREDLPEGAYYADLEQLAADLPKTEFGAIAKDRLRSAEMGVGDAVLELTGKTFQDKSIRLADFTEQVVLLEFFASSSEIWVEEVPTMQALAKKHGPAGFKIMGVSLDEDHQLAETTIRGLGVTWPILRTTGGRSATAALRFGVETVPHRVLIGPGGKVLDPRVVLRGDASIAEFEANVKKALPGKAQPKSDG